jgi:hypothetical protein
MGAFESGQSLMASVLAKLPESSRAQVEAAFQSAEARDAVTLIGDSALARSDYSKHMDGIRAQTEELKGKEQQLVSEFERLNSWYEVNKTALDDYKTLKATGNGGHPHPSPTPTPPKPDPAVDIRKTVDDAIADAGRDYVNLNMFTIDQAMRHYQMFGEAPDMQALGSNPKLGKPIAGQPNRIFSLQDAYNERYGERVAQKQKDAEDARINAEVEKRLVEERKKLTGQPFPIRDASPSVLDILSTKDGPAAHTIDSAVAEYERLQSARGQ